MVTSHHQGESVQSVDALSKFLINEFSHSTNASDKHCRAVADRITEEVSRICTESQRIQASGEIDTWLLNLARHRLKQCLKYYRLGSRRGRVELHSTLSAVVYRYITPPQVQSSYQARLNLIEDFLQNFYVEALSAFRRENQMPAEYCPRSLLELAEYMAFTERYGKRRIPLPRRRSQQLIILRAQTFSKQQPPETMVDIEQAAEGGTNETDQGWNTAPLQQVREQMVALGPEPAEDSLRDVVSEQLLAYLEERQQEDCADYFVLRLQDLPANEIETNLRPDATATRLSAAALQISPHSLRPFPSLGVGASVAGSGFGAKLWSHPLSVDLLLQGAHRTAAGHVRTKAKRLGR